MKTTHNDQPLISLAELMADTSVAVSFAVFWELGYETPSIGLILFWLLRARRDSQ